jgi:transcriptional regulator with XRE-family HTH domain
LDPIALANAVNSRMREQAINQRELADRSGVSVAALRDIQHGRPARRRLATLAALSRALGWPDDHLSNIYRGLPPVEGEHTRALSARLDAVQSDIRELAARVERLERR